MNAYDVDCSKGKFPFTQIETIELPQDPKTEKRRGFVFITYKEEAPVKKVMEKKYHNVGGSKVKSTCAHR